MNTDKPISCTRCKHFKVALGMDDNFFEFSYWVCGVSGKELFPEDAVEDVVDDCPLYGKEAQG